MYMADGYPAAHVASCQVGAGFSSWECPVFSDPLPRHLTPHDQGPGGPCQPNHLVEGLDQSLPQFMVAAVTNYYQLGGLK